MKKLFVLSLATLIWACEPAPTPSGPCEDGQWATALKNGADHCLGLVEVTYWNANSPSAHILFTAGEVGNKEIQANFAIPAEGIALNQDYPLRDGTLYGADELTSGSIRFLVFDPPSTGEGGCIAGTFTLTADGPDTPVPFRYTEGRFLYYKGTTAESDNYTDFSQSCNPFN